MPRALKPLLVEIVRNDKIGMSVDIFFDRDKKDFFATLFKVTHREKEHAKLTTKVWELMRASATPVWVDVIDVGETAPFCANNEDHFFGFELRRCHVWKRPDGHLMEAHWAPKASAEERLAHAHQSYAVFESESVFSEPWRGSSSEVTSRVPYSDELWEALKAVQEKLGNLKQTFRSLVRSEDGRQKLIASAGMPLLGAPKSGDDDE